MLLNSFKKELSEIGKLNFPKRNKTYENINVREENCFKRWENMGSFMRSYREGDRPWKSLIKRKIKS